MRDPNRIDKFCNELATVWKYVPDWRFTQLIINIFKNYEAEHHCDAFYEEDNDFMEYIHKCFVSNDENI